MKKSQIVLLDEATSSLDNQTEKEIKNTIDLLLKDKMAIIVAHRLSTIQSVDEIIVLTKGGQILERGTHNSLMKLNGEYAKLQKIT